MRILTKAFLFFGLTVVACGTCFARSDGQCTGRSMELGRAAAWESYNAGGITVEIRRCLSQGSGNYSYIDVKNPYSYKLCITVEEEGSRKRWSDYPVAPGDVIYWSTENRGNVLWRVGATRPVRSTTNGEEYCKSR